MIRHDEECPMPAVSVRDAGSPVMVGTMVQVPWLTVPLYAALFIALGWFGGEQWRNAPAAQKPLVPVAHAALVPLSQPAPQQAASVPVSAPTKQRRRPASRRRARWRRIIYRRYATARISTPRARISARL